MDEADPNGLNLRALLALQGSTLDWRGDLARLMRSDAPIDRMLRDRLAEAFENEAQDGPRLELKNHKPKRDRFVSVAARHQWMEIGRWVDSQRAGGMLPYGAADAAAAHFTVSKAKCEEALTYYARVRVWTDEALKSQAGEALGRDWLESLYHTIAIHPEMKPANANLFRQLGLSH